MLLLHYLCGYGEYEPWGRHKAHQLHYQRTRQLIDLSHPLVMGIMNVTPDSFFADSRVQTEEAIRQRAHQIMAEGAKIY